MILYTADHANLPALLESSFNKMLRDLAERYTLWMSSGRRLGKGGFGSLFEMAGASMKNQLEYMSSDAGLVAQFRAMQVRYAFCVDSDRNVSDVLAAFFLRMLRSGIGNVLAPLESAPEDTTLIMCLFWQWLGQYISSQTNTIEAEQSCYTHLTRLVSKMMLGHEDSQFRNTCRVFVWVEQDKQDRLELGRDHTILQSWMGTAVVKAGEPKTRYDQGHASPIRLFITKTKYKAVGDLEIYCYGLLLPIRGKIRVEYANSLDDAADALYALYYQAMTNGKFAQAKAPIIGKEANIYGNWIAYDDWIKLSSTIRNRATPITTDDTRTPNFFVVGLPRYQKESIVSKIAKIEQPTRNADSGGFTANVTFENGLHLEASLDWRIRAPEQYVEGEVYCPQCETVYNSVSECGMKDVKAYTPLCGPCLDRLGEDTNFDNLIDV
jgi:hypothetical protein